jgi:hypothetical protein
MNLDLAAYTIGKRTVNRGEEASIHEQILLPKKYMRSHEQSWKADYSQRGSESEDREKGWVTAMRKLTYCKFHFLHAFPLNYTQRSHLGVVFFSHPTL